MKIKYNFANEAIEIEIDEQWGDVLIDLDRREYNNNHSETRRHISLDGMDYEGDMFADIHADIAVQLEAAAEEDALYKAMQTLLPEQKELLHQIFFENRSVADIARQQGVSHVAILERLKRIYRQLEKKL